MSKEKVYDLRRATEQLNLYREIYNPENNFQKKESSNKLLSVASEEDKKKLKEIFDEYNLEDAEQIKNQIAKVKQQLEMLEEKKTTHQGIKLSRVMNGYEPSEEALKKIREHYRENKQEERNSKV